MINSLPPGLGSRILPMADPGFRPDGWIWYMCPLGCGWYVWMNTPPNDLLDWHIRCSRRAMSDHYVRSHGVEV